MKYYKFLDLDCSLVTDKMKQYVLDNPYLYKSGKGAWVNCNLQDVTEKVPSLQEMFFQLNLRIKRVSLFVMNYKTGAIHIDDDAAHPYRINFPVLNCENTETRFYQVKTQPSKQYQENKFAFHSFNPNDCEQMDSFELTKPTIIKTQEPHQVVVHHNNPPRISCTVAVYEDLEELFNRP